MITVIFPSVEVANEVTKNISATPDGVWVYYDPDDPGWDETIIDPETGEESLIHHEAPNVVQPLFLAEGKVSISHDFSQSDLEWLTEYCSDNSDIIVGNPPQEENLFDPG
jgi:hypothetical protein